MIGRRKYGRGESVSVSVRVRTCRCIDFLIVTKAGMTGQGFYNDPALCLSPLSPLSLSCINVLQPPPSPHSPLGQHERSCAGCLPPPHRPPPTRRPRWWLWPRPRLRWIIITPLLLFSSYTYDKSHILTKTKYSLQKKNKKIKLGPHIIFMTEHDMYMTLVTLSDIIYPGGCIQTDPPPIPYPDLAAHIITQTDKTSDLSSLWPLHVTLLTHIKYRVET